MSSLCNGCGAADDGTSAVCKFCKQPYSQALVDSALRCPSCGTPNRGERTQCGACGGSLLVTCLFCDHASPLREAACLSCREPFAGAQERKSAQQADKVIDAVGSVLGALTGSAPIRSGSGASAQSRDDDEPPRRGGGGRSGGRSGGGGGDAPPMDS